MKKFKSLLLILILVVSGCNKKEVFTPKPSVVTQPVVVTPPIVTPPQISGVEIIPVDSRLKSTNKGVITVPVVIINYIPTTDGIYLDKWRTLGPTVAWDDAHKVTLVRAKEKILRDKIIEKKAIEEGSRFRDYGTNKVKQYIDIDVVAYINVYDVNLIKVGTRSIDTTTNDNNDSIDNKVLIDWHNIDFNDLFEYKLKSKGFDLKSYVELGGVKEVWFTSQPKETGINSYNVAESNMSSPTGDISNGGGGSSDLPVYNKTYIVYGFNYSRGVPEDLHNRGHQIERQLDHIDQQFTRNIYYDLFASGRRGLGGLTHTPVNTLKPYEYDNFVSVKSSDIMGWSPNGGTFSNLNANTWINVNYQYEDPITMKSFNTFATGDVDYIKNPEYKWHIFWWQSIPGYENNITFSKYSLSISKADIDSSKDGKVYVDYIDRLNIKQTKFYQKDNEYIDDIISLENLVIYYYNSKNVVSYSVKSRYSKTVGKTTNWWNIIYNWDEAIKNKTKLFY
jgi:hypothetical protein